MMIIITKNNIYKWQPKILLRNMAITGALMLTYALYLYYTYHILLT